MELLDAIEKHGDILELQKKREELESIPDEALDIHTFQGRKMGRGNLFCYEVSSETINKTAECETWHEWFKPLMIRLEKEKKA